MASKPASTDPHDAAPAIRSVRALIAAHARNDPAAIALLAPGRAPLAFGALVSEVDRLVQDLANAGFGRAHRIAIALPNGPELALLLLAVSDCAAAAPLNPATDAPMSRDLLQRMRIDALIVAQDADLSAVQVANELRLPVMRMATYADDATVRWRLHADRVEFPAAVEPPAPQTVSLLLHTSGTTALPKIVPLDARNLADSAVARARVLQLAPADRGLGVTPLFTASGIRRNLLPTLCAGASLVCTQGFDADAFVDWLREFRPTFYTGSPAIHHAVLDLCNRRGALEHSLRFVMTTSAPMPGPIQDRLESALGVPVLQGYASSEGGVMAQSPLPPGERRPGSVGMPAGNQLAILTDSGMTRKSDTVGEILVRGPEVFEGYEDNPEANAEAFYEGWFRPGDLGSVDGDGHVYLHGRVSDRINRGGFKVSPSEVDAAMMAHPEVAEAATFAVPHPTLGDDVAVAVVLRDGASVSAAALRESLSQRLAAYKVPTRVILVTSIPKTALGKYRRRELAEAFAEQLRTIHVPPAGDCESIVASVFAEVLVVENVGRHDNFFDLGGDSLRGAQVVARLNSRLGTNLDPTTLFMRPSVAELADEIESGNAAPRSDAPPPIGALARRPPER